MCCVKLQFFLCCGPYIFPFFIQVKPALPALTGLIHSNDEEVLTDACWALSYLSDGTNDKIQAVIEAGVCPRLVELLLWVSHILCKNTHVTIFLFNSKCFIHIQAPISFSANSCSSYCWKYCYWRWYANSGIWLKEHLLWLFCYAQLVTMLFYVRDTRFLFYFKLCAWSYFAFL